MQNREYKLLSPVKVGSIALKNRIVMAPMTRCRAIGNIPNDLMADYYGQRAGAGLIITEGTSPSPCGLGYARIPGIYSKAQVEGWAKVTSAVHKAGGKIVIQLMHTGRISHPLNMPEGTEILAPSAVKAKGEMWTDSRMMQEYPVPKEMTIDDILRTEAEYVTAAKNAIAAGFDGVEVHGANGYLPEQFISPVTNLRKDNYGGSLENRCRFVIDIVSAIAKAIGKDKTGIRLSPYGVAGDMTPYPGIDVVYSYLSEKLNHLDIAYIDLLDHSAMGAPHVPESIKKVIRYNFKNTIILGGGYDMERAESDIDNGAADLIAFGKPYINNPDLVSRFKNNWPLSDDLHMDLFYTADARGYTDYPLHQTSLSEMIAGL